MAEVALAVVLVVGAGLLMRSFQKLMTVDAGFNRERLTTFGVVLPGAAYPKAEARVAFFNRLHGPAARVPGVTGRRRDDRPAAEPPGQRERHRLRGLHAAPGSAGRERRLLPDRHARLPEDDGDSRS